MAIVKFLCDWLYNYNVFMPEENDYDDDNDQPRNPITVIKYEKYTTWLYTLLLIVSVYILFSVSWVKSGPQLITISDITPSVFAELSQQRGETLSCPCSRATIPLKEFLSSKVTFHPVCSSIFISEEWIRSLYFTDASIYGVADFRSTASSQFELLGRLCSFSEETIRQNQNDIDHHELVTIYLLSQSQLQSEVNAVVKSLTNSISSQVISFMDYVRITTQANYVVSSLNTNSLIVIVEQDNDDGYEIGANKISYIAHVNRQDLSDAFVSCGITNPISPVGFFSFWSDNHFEPHQLWYLPPSDAALVNGFFTGCTPLEALLVSTLDCLYEVECLQLLAQYFPALNQTNWNWSHVVLASERRNVTVIDHLLALFIEDRSPETNYSHYFDACAPSSCSYMAGGRIDFVYAFAVFISLYGGLIITLRFIASSSMQILMKVKHRTRNGPGAIEAREQALIRFMKRLNLFKNAEERTERNIRQQIITTRVYLVLLTGFVLVLLFFNTLSTQTVITTVRNPSLTAYHELQASYPETLRCPCSTMALPYQTLLSLSPVLYPVCSSDFVSDRWIAILKESLASVIYTDWRNRAFSQFQLLSDLCNLANKTIDDALRRFLLQSFVASNALIEQDFTKQINATLNQFFQSLVVHFDLFVDIVRLLIQVDQPYMGTVPESSSESSPGVVQDITIDKQTNRPSMKFTFLMQGTRDVNSTALNCICATNPHCQSPVAIYDVIQFGSEAGSFSVAYMMTGSRIGCSSIESLRLSTLECLYSHSDCFSALISYVHETYMMNVEDPAWFDIQPLVYDPMHHHFPSNTSLAKIIEEIMIDHWIVSSSYRQFYQFCAPNYCTYSEQIRRKTLFGVIITLISMLGGLTASLRFITPQLIKIIARLFTKTDQIQEPQRHLKWSDRLKTILSKLLALLWTTALTLNIFLLRDFGSHVNRNTAKHLGQWATRLYMLVLISGLAIIGFGTLIQSQALRKTFEKPSLEFYKQLYQDYGDNLRCKCSSIAATYNQSAEIEPQFYQVCSSPFASDEWRINLTAGLVSNLSTYAINDYRRFLSAHLQFLQGLCELSKQSVYNAIEQFHSSLSVTAELQPEKKFIEQFRLLTDYSISNAPAAFTRLLSLIRSVNHGNAIISSYGTNFNYISPWYADGYTYAATQAVLYDNGCSCGLSSNCSTQAGFIRPSPLNMIPIKGFQMGCTPSESFRLSTLECFYDQLCLNLIQHYTNYTRLLTPLSMIANQSVLKMTVAELTDRLFIEQWSVTTKYSSYFHQCAPLMCSYTYTKKFNLLLTITFLLGLQGGLTIVLKWLCPKVVRIAVKISKHRQKQTNTVEPAHSFGMPSVEVVNTTIGIPISDLQSMPATISARNSLLPVQCSIKTAVIFILVTCVVATLVLFSSYTFQQNNNEAVTTVSSSIPTASTTTDPTTPTTTTTTTSTTTHVSLCQANFEQIPIYTPDSAVAPQYPIVADFNSDGRLDLGFFSEFPNGVSVLFGNGDGTFEDERHFSLLPDVYITDMATGDFNHDGQLDLAFSSRYLDYAGVWLGNGSGTFHTLTKLPIGNASYSNEIAVADLNSDRHLDIVVVSATKLSIDVFWGDGNGSFPAQTSLYTGRNSYPLSIAISDVNKDDYFDIVVVNKESRNIGVFLGHGDGSFEMQKTSFTGGHVMPYDLAVGDFNSDTLLDVAFSYDRSYIVAIMYGQGNGTFCDRSRFRSEFTWPDTPIAVADFNGDGYLDIAVGQYVPYGINVLLGDGSGNFQMQTVFATDWHVHTFSIVVGDLNGDGYQDLVTRCYYPSSLTVLLNMHEC